MLNTKKRMLAGNWCTGFIGIPHFECREDKQYICNAYRTYLLFNSKFLRDSNFNYKYIFLYRKKEISFIF